MPRCFALADRIVGAIQLMMANFRASITDIRSSRFGTFSSLWLVFLGLQSPFWRFRWRGAFLPLHPHPGRNPYHGVVAGAGGRGNPGVVATQGEGGGGGGR